MTKEIRGIEIKGMSVETRLAFMDRLVRHSIFGQHKLSAMTVDGIVEATIF